jgi:hypothetical protein
MFGRRVIHFEFRNCLSISHTGYLSDFRIIGENDTVNPKEAAKEIIEMRTGIKFTGANVQQKLF